MYGIWNHAAYLQLWLQTEGVGMQMTTNDLYGGKDSYNRILDGDTYQPLIVYIDIGPRSPIQTDREEKT